MVDRRRKSEAVLRLEERRRHEQGAPRLSCEFAALRALRLELSEYRPGHTIATHRHTRIIVVERAPALFVYQCSALGCDGEHDLTRGLFRNLRALEGCFEGEDECRGLRFGALCRYGMRYQASARYSG